MRTLKTVAAPTRKHWRKWLATHHDSESEVWLIFYKRHTGRASCSYEDAVQEALCFGWIDSIIKRIDDARYARKFTPRKPDSKWSTANRRRYEELQARAIGDGGIKRAPTARRGEAPRPPDIIPQYIEEILRASPPAWNYFEQLAPSYQRMYVAWIDSANRQEKKTRRPSKAVKPLRAARSSD